MKQKHITAANPTGSGAAAAAGKTTCRQETAIGPQRSANSTQHGPGHQLKYLYSDLEYSPLPALWQTGGDFGNWLQGIPVEVAN